MNTNTFCLIVLLLFALLIAFYSSGCAKTPNPYPKPPGPQQECGDLQECEIIRRTSQYRQQNNLNTLTPKTECVAMAEESSRYFANGGVFSHDRPNETYEQRAERFGCLGGENIAYGQPTPEDAMNAWKSSSGHNYNMLYTDWKYMGAGAVNNYWTQCFSR